MSKELKHLLLRLAKLSRSDQKWILHQLKPKHRSQFINIQGDSLLENAYKFRKLSCPPLPKNTESSLPETCKQLKQEAPLYIAIILEQGQFSWEQPFLQTCEQKHLITTQLDGPVKELKSCTKLFVFQQWQAQLSFKDQLENGHG